MDDKCNDYTPGRGNVLIDAILCWNVLGPDVETSPDDGTAPEAHLFLRVGGYWQK